MHNNLRDGANTCKNNKSSPSRNKDSIELLLRIKKTSNLLSRKENTIFDKYLENIGYNYYFSDNGQSISKDMTFKSLIFNSELSKRVSPIRSKSKFTVRKSKIDNDLGNHLKLVIQPLNYTNTNSIIIEDQYALEEISTPIKKKNTNTKLKSIIPQNVKVKNFKPDVARKFLVRSKEKFL